jgi:hypothetical protein
MDDGSFDWTSSNLRNTFSSINTLEDGQRGATFKPLASPLSSISMLFELLLVICLTS